MLDLLLKLSAFLVAILVLVTVHEFGHFWVARRLGVKVLRFSIGFGRALLSWRRRDDPTEYVLAAIPLGGYVKMLDEREEPVPEAELHLAFNRQRLWVRSAIVMAGPAFNFLLALVLYWLLFMAGQSGLTPEIGEVPPQSIAADAGFEPGDRVLAVGDRPTPTWSAVWLATLSEGIGGEDLGIRVQRPDGSEQMRVLAGDRLAELEPGQGFLDAIGLQRVSPAIPAVIGEVVPGQPAAEAGLETGDHILAIDGVEIDDWQHLVSIVQAHPDERLRVTLARDGERVLLDLHPRAVEVEGETSGRIGAGVEYPDEIWADQEVWVRYGPIDAVLEAGRRVVDVSMLTLRIVGKMLVGTASVENISSPIGIANAAGETASYGLASFVQFLALLSVSLGLINLFPIPVLDGGHLLYFAIEGVLGRPLSEAVQEQGQRVGIALLIALMTFAFYVDLAKLLG
ncbi:RIP metalloprotease RseP [Halochromatium salexigens]|uniref:Zinc metalloprotease n=1 Tax=Halochromatium salexigens TaxID=49447 RepID=A0AAJ0XFY3_HALSE|nr:RIP metalloprotease RseP [Halochromatium salexigens]MBK5930853.1 RIP metalloprotease RseP [Halochromatium salexigens]